MATNLLELLARSNVTFRIFCYYCFDKTTFFGGPKLKRVKMKDAIKCSQHAVNQSNLLMEQLAVVGKHKCSDPILSIGERRTGKERDNIEFLQ